MPLLMLKLPRLGCEKVFEQRMVDQCYAVMTAQRVPPKKTCRPPLASIPALHKGTVLSHQSLIETLPEV